MCGIFQTVISPLIKIDKNITHYNVLLFSFIKLKFRHTKKISRKKQWKLKNSHNETVILNARQPEKITVGQATYGIIDVLQDGNMACRKCPLGFVDEAKGEKRL